MLERFRTAGRWLTAIGFVIAGVLHFVIPDVYTRVVPPIFPAPLLMVLISGGAEIAGGLGLLVPRLRKAAGWGLIALLVAVWPVHFYMAFATDLVPRGSFPDWLVWVRWPLQLPMMAWVWWVSRPTARPTVAAYA